MVYTIGESVLDIIIKDFENAKLKPGGSMLNSAISLGRLGISTSHISYLSSDITSDYLIDFLRKNGVGTNVIERKAKKTNLALAYLNEQNDANYVFYKEDNQKEVEFQFPTIKANDIVLFGSLFCLNSSYRKSLVNFLELAKKNNALIIYDPNFRKPHLPELNKLLPNIHENFQFADIIKGSDEDFKNILNINTGEEVWNYLIKLDVKALLYTKGANGVEMYNSNSLVKVKTSFVNVKSTIGAGDTFSAGVIYSLVENKLNKNNILEITTNNWKEILVIANDFASEVCGSFDNYLDAGFIKKWKNVQ